MFYSTSKKEQRITDNIIAVIEENSRDENIPAIFHLVYKKVPITAEMRKRQYEEQLRKKQSINKIKTKNFL